MLTSRSFHFKSQKHLTVALSLVSSLRAQRETRDWISSSDLKTCCALGRLIVDILLIACDAGTRREKEWVKGHWTCTCDRFFIFISTHFVFYSVFSIVKKFVTKVSAAWWTDFEFKSLGFCVQLIVDRTFWRLWNELSLIVARLTENLTAISLQNRHHTDAMACLIMKLLKTSLISIFAWFLIGSSTHRLNERLLVDTWNGKMGVVAAVEAINHMRLVCADSQR